MVDSTMVYAFSRRRACDACGNCAFAHSLVSTDTYSIMSPSTPGEVSLSATTANLETMANARTPLAPLPLPSSSSVLVKKKLLLDRMRSSSAGTVTCDTVNEIAMCVVFKNICCCVRIGSEMSLSGVLLARKRGRLWCSMSVTEYVKCRRRQGWWTHTTSLQISVQP